MVNNVIVALYQSKNIFLLFSCYLNFWKSSYKQVTHKIFRELTTRMFAFNIKEVQYENTKSSQNKIHFRRIKSCIRYVFNCLEYLTETIETKPIPEKINGNYGIVYSQK